MKKDRNNRRETQRALAVFAQLGISMAACVFAGVFGGMLLDNWLGTSPWLLIVCSLLGAGASFKVMYDLMMKK